MNKKKRYLTISFSVLSLLILIFDSQTTISSAKEGINICIQTVIPSLFPFFFLSSILNQAFLGRTYYILKPLNKLCRIPRGAEILFLIGIIGGYPLGAKCINEAYESGAITKDEAERMLGFCNNPGPAFLFGISGAIFDNAVVPAVLYGIMIISAILTGIMLSGGSNRECTISANHNHAPLNSAIHAMANVCGWVILFRVIITFLEKWLFWLIPETLSILLSGLLEVTNGTLLLMQLENTGVKFILFAAIMSFGGFCIGMQTISVTGKLSCKTYFWGKLMQCQIAVSLAIFASAILFPGNIPFINCLLILIPIVICYLLEKLKNNAGNYRIHGV